MTGHDADKRDEQDTKDGLAATVRRHVAGLIGDDGGDRPCGAAGSDLPDDVAAEDLLAREHTDSLEEALRDYAIDHGRFAGVDYRQNGEILRVVTPVVPREPKDLTRPVRQYYNGYELTPDPLDAIRETVAESDALALFPVDVEGEDEPRCSLYYTFDGGDVSEIPQNHLLKAQRAVRLDDFVYDGWLPGDPPRPTSHRGPTG